MFKRKRVRDLGSIDDDVKAHIARTSPDLGMGAKGRRLMARYKMKEEKKPEEEQVHSRRKRAAFNAINYDR